MSRAARTSACSIRGSSSADVRSRSTRPIPRTCTGRSSDVCNQTAQGKSNHLKRCCSVDVQQIRLKTKEKNGTGKCATPTKGCVVAPKVVTKKEYEEFRECCRARDHEEEAAAIAAAENERERLMRESIERKEEFRRMDMMRPREKDAWLREIEEETRRRTMYVLERARNMRLEQEEEIQRCNRIILETKCRAIRDAQIAEKRLIEQEMAEEEKRLNDMMENERRWAIKEELRKEQEEAAKRQKFAKILKDQIVENEEQRLVGFEKKQEESRLMNLSNIAWQQEEIAKLRKKEGENARIRQELTEGNEQLKHLKALEEEENKIIDLRIKEYHRLKEERETKLEDERRLEKLKRDRERSRLVTRALQTQDLQAHIDEVNAARVQEEVERVWRQKEKEEALRKAEAQRVLIKEREEQINNKKIMQAIELERDRREFEKIVRVQKEAFCREKKELERKQRQALIIRSEILKQVNEKERARIQARQKMYEEGLAIRTEAEVRKKKLREAMERKCQEMKDNNVPEIYINEVKRMIESIQ